MLETDTDHASLEMTDARSKLDFISKSYFDPSLLLQPQVVDFESTQLKLSDNDERLSAKVAQALFHQKQLFERRIETYKAVHRNF